MAILSYFFQKHRKVIEFPDAPYAYSFETSFLYHKMPPQRPASELEHFDLAESLLHETMHWLHHHGSSIGAFLTVLRAVQRSSVIASLQALPRSDLVKRLSDRANGTPIFSLNESTHLPLLNNDWDAGKGDGAKRRFYLLTCAYAMFRHYSRLFNHNDPGTTIVYSILACSEMLQASLESDCLVNRGEAGRTAELLTKSFSPTYFDLADGHRYILDTEALFEASALLVEIALILNHYEGPFDPNRIQDIASHRALAALGRIHGLDEVDYTVAFTFASHLLKEPIAVMFKRDGTLQSDFFGRFGPSLMAALEIALNPPLPPLHTLDLHGLSWAHIYPPARFVNCVKAIRTVGTLTASLSEGSHNRLDYLRKMAAAAGAPFVAKSVIRPNWRLRPMLQFLDGRNVREVKLRTCGLLEFSLGVQYRLANLQERAGIGRPMDSFFNLYEHSPVPHHRALRDAMQYQRPPAIINEGKLRLSVSWPKEVGRWLLPVAMRDYVIHDLFVGVEQPILEATLGYPSLNTELLALIKADLEVQLGVDPW